MAESHVVSALVKKHARLKGELFYHQRAVERLQAALKATGDSIRIFEPSRNTHNIKAVRRQQRSEYFKQGECTRLVLGVLRESGEPMLSKDIVAEIIKIKGFDVKEYESHSIQASVVNALKGLARRKVVVRTAGIGGGNAWGVTAQSSTTA